MKRMGAEIAARRRAACVGVKGWCIHTLVLECYIASAGAAEIDVSGS